MLFLAGTRAESAPLWEVTNGETTVGPVPTELLVRGVENGRIDEDCWVRDVRSETWRRLNQVRELCALRRQGTDASASFACAGESLDLAADLGEAYLFLLHGAILATRSSVGVVHRIREPGARPVTSCVYGLPDERLGAVVSGADLALALALRGEMVVGRPDDGDVERGVAERLATGTELAAVAMVPVLYGTELTAMVELGRHDHPYRQSDKAALVRLATLTANRVEELSW